MQFILAEKKRCQNISFHIIIGGLSGLKHMRWYFGSVTRKITATHGWKNKHC
jgi:hypothetical protein